MERFPEIATNCHLRSYYLIMACGNCPVLRGSLHPVHRGVTVTNFPNHGSNPNSVGLADFGNPTRKRLTGRPAIRNS